MGACIAVVEKESRYGTYLKDLLVSRGHVVYLYSDPLVAVEDLDKLKINVVIYDFYTNSIRGDDFYTLVHKDNNVNVHFIFYSSRTSETIIKKLLLAKNADYMVKPLVKDELCARIDYALEKTSSETSNNRLKTKSIKINLDTYQAYINKTKLSLSSKEFNLLKIFVKNPNRVLTRELILNHVWDYNVSVSTRVVDVYVGYLRDKIKYIDNSKEYIKTVRGFGYMLED